MRARPGGSPVVLIASLALLTAGVLAVLYLTPLPNNSIWWREAQNASHIALFFMCAIVARQLARRYLSLSFTAASRTYFLAFGFACALALATELMQIGTAREASANDFIRDLAGAIAGLLILAAYDKATGWTRRRRVATATAAVFIIVLAGLNFMRWTAAYLERQHGFPQLTDFGSVWAAPFIELTDSDLEPVPAPAGFAQAHPGQVALLHIRQGRWPGIAHLEPYPDWSGYATFAVDLYNPGNSTHVVVLRIHDRSHSGDYEDRFNRVISLRPGLNLVRIALAEIERAPAGRPMNLREVTNFSLFAVQPAQAFDLYLGDFALLKQGVSLITSAQVLLPDKRR